MEENEKAVEEIKTTEPASEMPANDELEKLREALKAANKESAARRKKLEEYEKAEETRKLEELSEIDKTKALLETEQKTRAEIESKYNLMILEREFKQTAGKLMFEFANETAEKDAFDFLKGNGTEAMEDRMKELSQTRAYLFKQRIEKPVIDAQDKGTVVNGEMTEARKSELKQRIPSL